MASSTGLPPKPEKSKLVHQLQSSINLKNRVTRISCRTDLSYFAGRAGLIRILNLIVSSISVYLIFKGYKPCKLDENNESDKEMIRMMGNPLFSGYGASKYTMYAIVLASTTVAITFIFIFLLYLILEARCDQLWDQFNQKANIICCVLSVLAGFLNVMSIEEIQSLNCNNQRCKLEKYEVKVSKYEEEFYPPFFIEHYAAFVLLLMNAMMYSIASRIWLKNED